MVARRAQARRIALGLRQEDLAAKAGVTLPTLRRFESGANVGVEQVARIALALGGERGLAALFPLPETRSLDQILHADQQRSRVRRPR